jgi:hypothetical protein
MKLTDKQLKQIIKEEIEEFDDFFGEPWDQNGPEHYLNIAVGPRKEPKIYWELYHAALRTNDEYIQGITKKHAFQIIIETFKTMLSKEEQLYYIAQGLVEAAEDGELKKQ